jgi:hypothetical protein
MLSLQSLTARKEAHDVRIVNLDPDINVEGIVKVKTIAELRQIFLAKRAAAIKPADQLKVEADDIVNKLTEEEEKEEEDKNSQRPPLKSNPGRADRLRQLIQSRLAANTENNSADDSKVEAEAIIDKLTEEEEKQEHDKNPEKAPPRIDPGRVDRLKKLLQAKLAEHASKSEGEDGFTLEDEHDNDMHLEQRASYTEDGRPSHLREPIKNPTPEQWKKMDDIEKKVITDLNVRLQRRTAVRIKDEERQRCIAEAAEYIARARWPDYVLTSLSVLAIAGGVALAVCTHGVILAVPIVIPAVAKITVDAVKDGVKVVQTIRKNYSGWDKNAIHEGNAELVNLHGSTNKSANMLAEDKKDEEENRKEVKKFLTIVKERTLVDQEKKSKPKGNKISPG